MECTLARGRQVLDENLQRNPLQIGEKSGGNPANLVSREEGVGGNLNFAPNMREEEPVANWWQHPIQLFVPAKTSVDGNH